MSHLLEVIGPYFKRKVSQRRILQIKNRNSDFSLPRNCPGKKIKFSWNQLHPFFLYLSSRCCAFASSQSLKMPKEGEPVIGVPYYAGQNPYQAGMVPPNAIYGDPMGAPIQQTFYRDTPAPFNCLYCGNTGLTHIRLTLSIYPFTRFLEFRVCNRSTTRV